MITVLLDTNVIVSLLNPADARHDDALTAVRAWERRAALFSVSAVTWSELRVGAIRSGHAAVSALREFRDRALDRIIPLDEEIAESAAQLRAGDLGLRLPDALILATAHVIGAHRLLSADKKLQRADPAIVESTSR
ncbi:PIN domain-containing protein [Nonomuraea sp. NPDC050310]|uniref:type II toxin-antitoxin system VapC family toxin n=1 Tax=unclassified Nonomuraea TaxID=2593643 RepID=UPI0033E62076